MHLTKNSVDKAQPIAGKDQVFYRDDDLKGFALRVTAAGVKSFVVETQIANKVKRMTLGKYGKLTVDQARKQAKILLGQIAMGENPIAKKQAERVKGVSLKEAFEDYLSIRKSLKPSTINDYRRVLREVMSDWLDKPLVSLNKDTILKRHAEYGENNSQARSNYAMRVLGAIFNFAIKKYRTDEGGRIILENPIEELSNMNVWYHVPIRQSYIKRYQLADWYYSLMSLTFYRDLENAQLWQDYFLLLLFTGLRRNEAASLRWEHVDLRERTFIFLDPKNRHDHKLPMSDFLYELFLQRKKASGDNEFVFPANNKAGYINEPRKTIAKVVKLSGVEFTPHDLRRTFITNAENLDIPAYALKRLLNHKMKKDVTAGYIMNDVERLRRPMQKVTDYLLLCIHTVKIIKMLVVLIFCESKKIKPPIVLVDFLLSSTDDSQVLA